MVNFQAIISTLSLEALEASKFTFPFVELGQLQQCQAGWKFPLLKSFVPNEGCMKSENLNLLAIDRDSFAFTKNRGYLFSKNLTQNILNYQMIHLNKSYKNDSKNFTVADLIRTTEAVCPPHPFLETLGDECLTQVISYLLLLVFFVVVCLFCFCRVNIRG